MKMNNKNINLSQIDTVILAGGLGTRLQSVIKDKPKCLALINGKPFIDILLDNCIKQGLQRFILCVCHLKDQIIKHLNQRNDCEIVFSIEQEPLGTGGAVKNAETFIKSNSFFLLNGDSQVNSSFSALANFNTKKKGDMSLLLSAIEESQDYGNVNIDDNHRIILFNEKPNVKTNSTINAGVYFMQKFLVDSLTYNKNYSLEKDLLPVWIKKYNVFGKVTNSSVLDIGTPKRLSLARKIMLGLL